ncbi:hypothetical protein I7I50_08324 [Histoplasma capsulatum G186AR]|uniref:Uncharacterized protein n=1 Tax=Ajellomyces capsulatus TaxID=5037 RepID=A0A8H8CYU9_AJECA|nr:hypothetical protein I7I52_05840 [Histoplasma capsulatum]QSS73527.1 hypothetical protein I7I50_08324 [Histoplasma capsulatum G186AR]
MPQPTCKTGKHGCQDGKGGFEEKKEKEKEPSDADATVVGIAFLAAAVGHLNAMRPFPLSRFPCLRALVAGAGAGAGAGGSALGILFTWANLAIGDARN